jgi:hypothetical protein
MTYRGFLISFLAAMLVGLGVVVVYNQPGGIMAALTAPREILDAARVPKVGTVPINAAYRGSDGTLYMVGDGKNALVRDPDGNLRTLPLTAMPRDVTAVAGPP